MVASHDESTPLLTRQGKIPQHSYLRPFLSREQEVLQKGAGGGECEEHALSPHARASPLGIVLFVRVAGRRAQTPVNRSGCRAGLPRSLTHRIRRVLYSLTQTVWKGGGVVCGCVCVCVWVWGWMGEGCGCACVCEGWGWGGRASTTLPLRPRMHAGNHSTSSVDRLAQCLGAR